MNARPFLALFCLTFLIIPASLSQSRIALKAGPTFTYQTFTRILAPDEILESTRTVSTTWIVPSLLIAGKKGINHQLSVEVGTADFSDYSLSDTVPVAIVGEVAFDMQAGLKYQLMIFLIPEEKSIRPYLGASLQGVLAVHTSNPYTSTEFRTREFIGNLYGGGIIGSRIKVRDRGFLDIDVGYAPIRLQYLNERINDPILPIRQQTTNTVNLDLFANLSAALAFGIWL